MPTKTPEPLKDLLKMPKPAKAASKKDPLPDGWLTPSGFAKQLSESTGTDVRPQRIYGYVKSGKDFPFKNHTDGRVILDVAKAIKWFNDLQARKTAKEESSEE